MIECKGARIAKTRLYIIRKNKLHSDNYVTDIDCDADSNVNCLHKKSV